MTKAELFRKAHQLAKTFTSDYRARFSLALVELTGIVKAGHIYTEGESMKVKITITCDNDITANLFEEVLEVTSIQEAKEKTQVEFNKISDSKKYPIGYFDRKSTDVIINSLSFENGSNGLVAMNHPRFMVNIFNVA